MNWVFKNNINTDLITPGRYNITTNPKELKKIAFIEYLPEFSKKVKPGDLIIAGKNFGCGSSRETAVTALKACGVKAIIAQSFARIFYRNCLNGGLLAIKANTNNIKKNTKINLKNYNVPQIMKILHQENGVLNYINKYSTEKLYEQFK